RGGGLDDRGSRDGAAADARVRGSRRDPGEDRGAAGGLAQAGRGGLRAGHRAGSGIRGRLRRRRLDLRRRGRRGGRVRGGRRGGEDMVTDEVRHDRGLTPQGSDPRLAPEPTETQEEGDQLALLRAERDEAVDRWKRTAADFENYKRRAAREREEYVVLANER